MKIKIDAIDTLFFKDGKPFSMGDETWADGIFPPPPSVIYGALRTAYFGENPEEFLNANTDDDPTKHLVIKSIYFQIGNDKYFPMPLDYVKKKNQDKNDKLVYLMDKMKPIQMNSSGLNQFLSAGLEEEVESVPEALIAMGSMGRYLKGIEKTTIYSLISDYVQTEPKVGMGRDNKTHTADEGKLYRVGMRRLSEMKTFNKVSNTLSLLVEFEGLTLAQNGFLKLGAEGKAASYKIVDEEKVIVDFSNNNEKTICKIYLLTPALFKNGWKPDFENNETLRSLELELITACIGKPLSFGGFDMQKKMPKPMRKAVPAGSVYYVVSKTKKLNEIFDQLNGKSVSDFNSTEGFGIAYIGSIT